MSQSHHPLPGHDATASESPRSRILTKLRQSMQDAPGAEGKPASAVRTHFERTATLHPALPHAEQLAHFIKMMRAVQTEVHLVRETNWPERLASVVKAKGVRQLLLAPQTPHGARAAQAVSSLPQAPVLRQFDRDIEHWKAELFAQVDASFTTTRSLIAETGSLILWPNADEPRTMSLVPPLHIALADGAKLHGQFHDAVHAEGWAKQGMPTNALLVSGPSKTSDIQQTLAYGAHGPRWLVLLLVVPDEIDLQALAQATGASA